MGEVPKKQMAMVLEKTGGPVEYKEIDVPKPGPDEVLVNIKYSGVCHTDLHAVNGDWPVPTKLPLVGGHEGAGVVVAKGDHVTGLEIGDHAGVKWINGSCLECDSASSPMSHCAPRLFFPATLLMGPSSNTALSRARTLLGSQRIFRSTLLLQFCAPVSRSTRA